MRRFLKITGDKLMRPWPRIPILRPFRKTPRLFIRTRWSGLPSNTRTKVPAMEALSQPPTRSVISSLSPCLGVVCTTLRRLTIQQAFHRDYTASQYKSTGSKLNTCMIAVLWATWSLSCFQVLYYSPVNPSAEHGRSSNSPRRRQSEA